MTDLILNDESTQYRDLARDFSENEIAPHAHKFDESRDFPQDICQKAWDIGLFNASLPETAGGMSLSLLDTVLIAEEIGRGCTGIGSVFEAHQKAVAPLLVIGDKEQMKQFLKPLCDSFAVAGYCTWGQPEEAVKYRKSADKYILSGSSVVGVNASKAVWHLISAVSTSGGGDQTLFVVPAGPKVKLLKRLPMMGRRCADVWEIALENVEVDSTHLVSEEGGAPQVMRNAACSSALITAAMSVGLAQSALENSLRYSQERQTFGKPISQHQAVTFMLADMAREIEASRLMCYKAAWYADQSTPSYHHSSMARVFSGECAIKAATDAVQIYGGYGYSKEYPVEKLMRDAKMLQIFDGTNHEQKLHLGKELIAAVEGK